MFLVSNHKLFCVCFLVMNYSVSVVRVHLLFVGMFGRLCPCMFCWHLVVGLQCMLFTSWLKSNQGICD